MARRRMISNAVTDAYRFQSMEPQTQLLYVYLCLKADDDGFVGNPYLFTHLTGCGERDLETLAQRGYVILFESGIAAVVHWHIHNTIKKDRYNPTVHTEELAQLRLEDKCYVRIAEPEPERNQNGTKTEPQYSLVKSSQVKSSQIESSQAESSQVESSQVESSQVKSSQVESSQDKSNQDKSSQIESSQDKSSQDKSTQDDFIPRKKNSDRTVKRDLFSLFSYDYLFSVKEISVCKESKDVQKTAKPHAQKHTAWKSVPVKRPCRELIGLKKQRPHNKDEPRSPLLVC